MLNVDTLLSLCEISAALAGFSSIVTVVDRDRTPDSWGRLQSVLLICILVIAASLIPVLLNEYGLEMEALYRIAALAFLGLIWLTILAVDRIARGIGGNIWKNVGGPSANVIMWTLEVLIQVPLLFCVFALFPAYDSAFYLTAIILNLFQAALLFYLLAIHPRLEA